MFGACLAPTRRIDPVINDALRIVTGCLRPTPADNLTILAGIQPAGLHCIGTTMPLAPRGMEPGNLLHLALTRLSSANAWRLKSRHQFVPAPQHLITLSDNNNIRAAQWADHQWNAEYVDNPTRLRIFIPDTGTRPLRNGVGGCQRHRGSNGWGIVVPKAYRAAHPTETALLRVHHDITSALDKGSTVALVMLDQSAAFDVIDHDILLQRLELPLKKWSSSYLLRKRFLVAILHRRCLGTCET